jgi:uncharacterized protein
MVLLDVRSEADYNIFHIIGARNIQPGKVKGIVKELLREPAANTVYVVMSNDESAATEVWKVLVADSVPNVYILEGGINNWIRTFAGTETDITPIAAPPGNDRLAYIFSAALGSRHEAANPDPLIFKPEYTPKIKIQLPSGPSGGGCG